MLRELLGAVASAPANPRNRGTWFMATMVSVERYRCRHPGTMGILGRTSDRMPPPDLKATTLHVQHVTRRLSLSSSSSSSSSPSGFVERLSRLGLSHSAGRTGCCKGADAAIQCLVLNSCLLLIFGESTRLQIALNPDPSSISRKGNRFLFASWRSASPATNVIDAPYGQFTTTAVNAELPTTL